jgi:hypothetical protein
VLAAKFKIKKNNNNSVKIRNNSNVHKFNNIVNIIKRTFQLMKHKSKNKITKRGYCGKRIIYNSVFQPIDHD